MKIPNMPGFTAQATLQTPLTRYCTSVFGGSDEFRFVQPQAVQVLKKGKCWCDEPDTNLVCDGGSCKEVPVCLQWSCPSAGIDDFPGSTTVYSPAGPAS